MTRFAAYYGTRRSLDSRTPCLVDPTDPAITSVISPPTPILPEPQKTHAYRLVNETGIVLQHATKTPAAAVAENLVARNHGSKERWIRDD